MQSLKLGHFFQGKYFPGGSSTTRLDVYRWHLQEVKCGFFSGFLPLRFCCSESWKVPIAREVFCDVNASSLSVILAGDKGAGTVEEPDVCALGFRSSFVKTLFLLDCLISSRLWSGDCGSLCLTALEASPERCWLSLTGVHLGCLWVRTLFLNVLPISDDGWS